MQAMLRQLHNAPEVDAAAAATSLVLTQDLLSVQPRGCSDYVLAALGPPMPSWTELSPTMSTTALGTAARQQASLQEWRRQQNRLLCARTRHEHAAAAASSRAGPATAQAAIVPLQALQRLLRQPSPPSLRSFDIRLASPPTAADAADVWTLARMHPACVEVRPRRSEILGLLRTGNKLAGVRAFQVVKSTVRTMKQKEVEV
jgi:hypothetical protein